ncbi:MAG: DinB family protein [Gemmatimonadota bacterium]
MAVSQEVVVTLLRETGSAWTEAIRDVTDIQFAFKPAPDKWSIAETAEHVTFVEASSGKLIRTKLTEQAADEATLAATVGKEQIIESLNLRERIIPAPEMVQPKGRWGSNAEMMAAFEDRRNQTVQFMESSGLDLRKHALPHPLLGMLNGYQWGYFMALHCRRHIAQIREIMASPEYPA